MLETSLKERDLTPRLRDFDNYISSANLFFVQIIVHTFSFM
jgi:hypothetical protein